MRSIPVTCLTLALTATAFAAETYWKPVADDVYLQEVGTKIPTDSPVTSVAVVGDVVYAVQDGVIKHIEDGLLTPLLNSPDSVNRIEAMDGALWALTAERVWRIIGNARQLFSEESMVDLCMHQGTVYGATHDEVFKLVGPMHWENIKPETGWLTNNTTNIMEDGTQILPNPIRLPHIERIGSYSETIYLMGPGRLSLLVGPRLIHDPIDWGTLPSRTLRDMMPMGSRLYTATDRGVAVLRGMAMTALDGANGLPYANTTCLAEGFDRDLWIGTTTGAIRKVGDEYHYFGADHWLPGDGVNEIAVSDDTVYIATNAGLGIIRYEPYTLLKKAKYFERNVEEWGHKRLGFVHKLWWHDGDKEWRREISDNDGGHTAHYLAAMCFKYAATGDRVALAEARNAFEAMIWLEAITPKEGFFARAIWSVQGDKGELARQGSGGLPAKWYDTDDGLWVWKGDTSSDEVNAHYYSVALYHDLVAKGAEKDRAAEHLRRITNHIIDEGWVLRDMDGKPTRWGRWDPDYLLRPYGIEARGLNGMEAQSYVWTVWKLTGDPKFKEGLDQLIEWRYHTYTVRQKHTFPPESVVPWDDELAFRAFHPLLNYADDPHLRSIYMRSLERHWEVMRMQKIPYFNFMYGGLTGNDCEEEVAAQHLREWSLDTIGHNYRNSHRADLGPEPGYVPYALGTRAISPRESKAMWGSRSAINYDGGSNSRGIEPPVGWLEDYWMGRYYGIIEAPTTKDRDAINIERRPMRNLGAAPYEGPARPKNL